MICKFLNLGITFCYYAYNFSFSGFYFLNITYYFFVMSFLNSDNHNRHFFINQCQWTTVAYRV